MSPEQIEYLINQYDQRAEKALKDDNKGEWRRYSAQAKRLKKWRDEDGAADSCPVNYEEDGLTLDGATVATPEKIEVKNRTDVASYDQLVQADKLSKPAQSDRADILYNEANEAYKKEDWGKAKHLAEQLTRLGDSRGEEIIVAVALRDGVGEGKVNAGTLQKIKIALCNRDNVEVLGNGVRDAEQIRARGQADEELLTLLKDARARWNEMREHHGQITTKSRIGTLETMVEAVTDLETCIIENHLTLWDSTFDSYRRTSEILSEAQRHWQKLSKDEADIEIDLVRQELPNRLDWAKQRLINACERKYYSYRERNKKDGERVPAGYLFRESERSLFQKWIRTIEAMIAERDRRKP